MLEEDASSSISFIKKAPILFIILSATLLALSIFLGFFQSKRDKSTVNFDDAKSTVVITHPTEKTAEKLQVDVAGSVKRPGLYHFDNGARVMDAIEKAQGLSKDADIRYFERNINRAELLHDQEKLYIPSTKEVQSGLFAEQRYTEDSSSSVLGSSAISINSSSKEDIEGLPQIGPATADKIIGGRPYGDVYELLDKKIVNKGQFESIRTLISL